MLRHQHLLQIDYRRTWSQTTGAESRAARHGDWTDDWSCSGNRRISSRSLRCSMLSWLSSCWYHSGSVICTPTTTTTIATTTTTSTTTTTPGLSLEHLDKQQPTTMQSYTVRHAQGVRSNKAANFRRPPFWTVKIPYSLTCQYEQQRCWDYGENKN